MDDDWPEPEPWGWRGNAAAFAGIVAIAVGLHYTGIFAPKLPTMIKVTQYNIPKTHEFCHPAKFYFTGDGWICAR